MSRGSTRGGVCPLSFLASSSRVFVFSRARVVRVAWQLLECSVIAGSRAAGRLIGNGRSGLACFIRLFACLSYGQYEATTQGGLPIESFLSVVSRNYI